MATFTYDDISFTKQLDWMTDNVEYACKKALYEGAGILADSIKTEIDSIPDSCLLNDKERDDLKDGMVISRFQNSDGDIIAYIDFAGYNNWVMETMPGCGNGEPIRLIARAICKGTPKLRKGKYNFVRKGFDKAKKDAEETMRKTIEDELNKSQNQ